MLFIPEQTCIQAVYNTKHTHTHTHTQGDTWDATSGSTAPAESLPCTHGSWETYCIHFDDDEHFTNAGSGISQLKVSAVQRIMILRNRESPKPDLYLYNLQFKHLANALNPEQLTLSKNKKPSMTLTQFCNLLTVSLSLSLLHLPGGGSLDRPCPGSPTHLQARPAP